MKKQNFDELIDSKRNEANLLRECCISLCAEIEAKQSQVLTLDDDAEIEDLFSTIEDLQKQVHRKKLLARRAELQACKIIEEKTEFLIARAKEVWTALIDEVPIAESTLTAAQQHYDELQAQIRLADGRLRDLERALQNAQIEASKIATEKFDAFV